MGLIGGMARTAVVAGTATAVSNRVSRRQAGRWSAQEQQQYQQQPAYAPPPYEAPPPQETDDGSSLIAQLEKLGQLRDKGILTDEEFAQQKARILSG
jgi:Short C-terminal domain